MLEISENSFEIDILESVSADLCSVIWTLWDGVLLHVIHGVLHVLHVLQVK